MHHRSTQKTYIKRYLALEKKKKPLGYMFLNSCFPSVYAGKESKSLKIRKLRKRQPASPVWGKEEGDWELKINLVTSDR